MTDTEAARRGRQLNLVVAEFRDSGVVDAHLMLLRHSISRLAHYIHLLRREWGHDSIITLPREQGDMASYRLVKPPESWTVTTKARKRPAARGSWSCVKCGTPAPKGLALVKETPTMARAMCPTCHAGRMFRVA